MRPPRRPPQADGSKSFPPRPGQGRFAERKPRPARPESDSAEEARPRGAFQARGDSRPRRDEAAPRPRREETAPRPRREETEEAAPRPRPEREFFAPKGGRKPRPFAKPDLRGSGEARRAPEAAPAIPVPPGSFWLHGVHAVAAALANPARRARRLLLTEEAEANLAAELPRPWRLNPERVERARFQTFLPEDAVHQGAALLVDPLQPVGLEEAIEAHDGPVLLLDQVTDPRNVGAILRSAAAFGAAAVVVQDRNAPPETAAMARAASGALEIVPMVREVNIARAISTLQKAGFWVLGMDGSAKKTLAAAVPSDRRVALVLGAEDTGLRRLQRESVDELVKLPIAARMESLNVSAAAAAALYELAREKDLG